MLKIEPANNVEGKISAPPSKSYTHRAFFLALLAERESKIINPLISDDTLATINVIRGFGADFIDSIVIPPEKLRPNYFFVRESGTTARITVAISSLADGISIVEGRGRLKERPMEDLVKALSSMGVKVYGKTLPVKVYGGRGLSKHEVVVNASKSSQFVTALLLLGSRAGLKITALNPVSRPYIDMTLRTMKAFGVKFRVFENTFEIEPGVRGSKFRVPGDYSSAAFFLIAGALFGRVRVENLHSDDVQADMKIIEILRKVGAKVRVGKDYVEVEKGELRPFSVDCSNFPDLFPILSVLASYIPGRSIITGKQLRLKESDRVRAMAFNLSKVGVNVRELPNGLEINGGRPKGGRVETFGDHRIAMAMAILALGSEKGVVIPDPNVVNKSYPGFFEDLRRVSQ
ncbi:3-phosphoshikimate 1-carboxyvinyltransferase [Pyrococcus sp. ST04]|uniref:3-phosphoshikimate 1-carboxyvinyltransferase n=1 Tax=Pyrococcus sp. ST04 TaxID=1183377 RepID=UPI0002605E71|nr:3-phosphoshikimate 1-carboxyvinyltransferase [Pyrococcus sp. ST04]AFK23186.1 3-phosphoshikimate 1-carboxyvinyltransferase [Pyrococcus sp. ST04]